MMRLSKYLSACGVASRRKADELIQEGKVRVNSKTVTAMGFRVDPEEDKVTFQGQTVVPPKKIRILMLNKPPGVMTTLSDPHADQTVMQFVDHYEERLFPVGRLDRDSEGLLLFTNDGELAHRLTHPRFHLDKEYEVVVEGSPRREDIEQLRQGVEIDGHKTSKSNIHFVDAVNGRQIYTMVIHEGRKRQVRRMFEEVGAKVVALRRIRVGPVKMGHLPIGSVREVKGEELKALRNAVGLSEEPDLF